ncbi:MAG TPA: cupin domain-containing protein [Panacibacter sp.]|nr:cupin domain-containing protein [Panacibacter sp.]HNP45159.1 cupin domain-containing protein [Panacibacter sp.]
MKQKANTYIETFGLKPHPEGGYYVRSYQSEITIEQTCLPGRFNGSRLLSTAIYYLLKENDFSAFHRLNNDECWHFYAGGSLALFIIENDGSLQQVILGNNIAEKEVPQFVIKAGKWFAAAPCAPAAFSFVGCTLAPGFDFDDLEFANRDMLVAQYPTHKSLIEKFTR